MSRTIDLPDGWHQLPGDGEGVGREINTRDNKYGSIRDRWVYWTEILGGEIVALSGFSISSSPVSEFYDGRAYFSKEILECAETIWGVSVAELLNDKISSNKRSSSAKISDLTLSKIAGISLFVSGVIALLNKTKSASSTKKHQIEQIIQE